MAEIIKTIKSSGGDYTTLALWEADISADETDDQTASIEEAFEIGAATIDVSNSNAVTLKITVKKGFRFNDGASWPAIETGFGEGATCVGTGNRLLINTTNVIIEWLEIATSSEGGNYCIGFYTIAENCDVRHCVFHPNGGTGDHRGLRGNFDNGTPAGTEIIKVWDCVFIEIKRCVWAIDAKWLVAHCSGFWESGSGTGGIIAQKSLATTSVCEANNNHFSGYTDDYEAVGISYTNSDYNASSDTTAPGTNAFTSQTAGDWWENVTAGTIDLHLKSSVDGDFECADVTAGFDSIDLDEDTRSDMDCGFDEIAGATGTNIQLNISDAWKSVSAMQINIGDAWKSVDGAQVNIGDAWKTIF